MNTANRQELLNNSSGLVRYWKQDLLAGFLVFLIALPLCLGIAAACGYPPIAGIFIAVGCVTDFGGGNPAEPDSFMAAYRLALGVGVAAGILQILFAVFRSGIL